MAKDKLTGVKKILQHPDREELISKLLTLDISTSDIHEWLSMKYATEPKLVIAASTLKSFKENHLDVYQLINEDIQKTKNAIANATENELDLAIQENPTYKSKMMELAGKEIDIRAMAARLAIAIETRLGQVFDSIQLDERSINPKLDRVLIEYAEVFGNILERYYKFTEAPQQINTQNNISIQVVDSHVAVIQETIREVLGELDLTASMLFMERLSEKMSKLKAPSLDPLTNTDTKLAEVKLLNETINQKLNS